jgi:hypothetical protein
MNDEISDLTRRFGRTRAVDGVCGEVAPVDAGKIVFRGTPDELTARGVGTGAAGDAPLGRGYGAVLAAARPARAMRS